MNRTVRTVALAAGLALLGGAAGCASRASKTTGEASATAGAGTGSTTAATSGSPKVLTSLSSLSPAKPLGPLDAQGAAIAKVIGPENATSLAAAKWTPLSTVRHVGNDQHPGEERLLNDKAARFDLVCIRIMDHLFTAMQELEATDPVVRIDVPADLKPVIVTGILNRHGQLKELILEQHSGQSTVDNMVIEACKRGLYIGNPPPQAITPNGDYRVRIEARIESFGSTDRQHWLFKTYIGMALL
jgi:hypothetical protein